VKIVITEAKNGFVVSTETETNVFKDLEGLIYYLKELFED